VPTPGPQGRPAPADPPRHAARAVAPGRARCQPAGAL